MGGPLTIGIGGAQSNTGKTTLAAVLLKHLTKPCGEDLPEQSDTAPPEFEHADIHANVITRRKALKVGENLDLEIELVNAGKGPALLTRITEVIPKSFEVIEKPEVYRVEDSYLNMKGKRLDPLKTEEVKLVLQPKARGTFPLKPTILYLDEDGKHKIHEAEPVTITVKELGIKGWIKGEK